MAAQAYTPEIDPEDPPRGWQRLLQATTLTGSEGTPWEALHTALYGAQGFPNRPDTQEPTEAWVRQAKAMRNYNLHHPFDNSPAALPWPANRPKTVPKLVNLTRSYAKATLQTPTQPRLRYPGQQTMHPFFQPHAPPAPPPPVTPKRARRKRGALAPNQARKDRRSTTSHPPAPPPPTLPPKTRTNDPHHPPSHHYHQPTRTKHPHHPPSGHQHRPNPKRTQISKRA